MRQKLFTVTDCFEIARRGTAIVGDRQANIPDFKIGNSIVLTLPEGQEIVTKVSDIELTTTISGRRLIIGVLIENFTKRDIPIGTEVFLSE